MASRRHGAKSEAERAAAEASPAKAGSGGSDLTVSTFNQSGKDMHVTVEKPEDGFMCTLSMVARVPLPPDRLYDMLVNPDDCKRVFKSLKRVANRRVVAEDEHGNRTVEVDQTGTWRFLLFRGSFTMRMIVEQRRQEHTIRFRLARPGFMRDFTGTWRILPYDNASLDQLVNRHNPTRMHRFQTGLRAVEQQLGLLAPPAESLVHLQQSVMPAVAPPATIVRALQRIAAKQISLIMSDLQAEVARINAADAAASSSSSTTTTGSIGQDGKQQQPGNGQQTAAQQLGAGQQQSKDKKQLVAHVRDLR